jgi:hypothetical protein
MIEMTALELSDRVNHRRAIAVAMLVLHSQYDPPIILSIHKVKVKGQ